LPIPAYDLIIDIKTNLITFIPGVLGFTIGGYSFLIGFIQPGLMNKISEPRKDSPFSLFQVASSSFASNILVQTFSLIIAFVIHYAIYIDAKVSISNNLNTGVISFVNGVTLIIGLMCLIFSLVVIIQLVVNVFNFSQLHHYQINKEKLDALTENAD
jgi:uncharacterized membrane protein YphA (DoxX/SURF4 family)